MVAVVAVVACVRELVDVLPLASVATLMVTAVLVEGCALCLAVAVGLTASGTVNHEQCNEGRHPL